MLASVTAASRRQSDLRQLATAIPRAKQRDYATILTKIKQPNRTSTSMLDIQLPLVC
jgi:hypothetical protein